MLIVDFRCQFCVVYFIGAQVVGNMRMCFIFFIGAVVSISNSYITKCNFINLMNRFDICGKL